MILKMAELEAIKAGGTRVVFRRWFRPSVKAGGALKTALGVLRIDEVRAMQRSEITELDALTAGYESRNALLRALDAREGEIFRIAVRYEGADPRLALRENVTLSTDELRTLLGKLARLDAASHEGPWTKRVLQTLRQHPKVVSAALAKKLGYDQRWLKLNIRKLKNLGLTISHEAGYEVSPRGEVVLRALERADADS